MKAIGISGYAGSGKTTVANYIEARYGYRRQHIATTLRSMLHVLLADLGYGLEDKDDILEGSRKDGWIIPELGVTSRHLQITIGTEWGRELVDEDIWVKTWMHLARKHEAVMNDSVRFPNEERGIRELGGFTILIDRPGTRPAKFMSRLGRIAYDWFGSHRGIHPSERLDRLDPDHVVVNGGSLETLYRQIDDIMLWHGIEPLPTTRKAA